MVFLYQPINWRSAYQIMLCIPPQCPSLGVFRWLFPAGPQAAPRLPQWTECRAEYGTKPYEFAPGGPGGSVFLWYNERQLGVMYQFLSSLVLFRGAAEVPANEGEWVTGTVTTNQESNMKKIAFAALVLALALPSLSYAADLASDANYKKSCAMCHGNAGEGKAAMKTKPMKEYGAKSAADLTKTIENGVSTGSPKMPSYKDKLTPDQIKTLVAEIKAAK
jgi:mono/diheme cytochrome c family protein